MIKSEYRVKDSFQFSEKICEQDRTLPISSLDVDSHLTNIHPDETIDICVNQLFGSTVTVEGFTKSELKQILELQLLQRSLILHLTVYFTNRLMV